MSLTRTVRVTTEEEVAIRVPTYWGMFTDKGNKRITQLARKLYDKANDNSLSLGKKVDALIAFKNKWYNLGNYKSYSEAGDTAVRESIWSFFEVIADAIGVYDADELWDNS